MAVERTCLAIVLAAGEGTRMRSTRPKVLHAIAGQSLLAHVLDAVRKAGGTMTAVVVGLAFNTKMLAAGIVVPGLVPGIHVIVPIRQERRRWPGHRRVEATPFFERLGPAMTKSDSSADDVRSITLSDLNKGQTRIR